MSVEHEAYMVKQICDELVAVVGYGIGIGSEVHERNYIGSSLGSASSERYLRAWRNRHHFHNMLHSEIDAQLLRQPLHPDFFQPSPFSFSTFDHCNLP